MAHSASLHTHREAETAVLDLIQRLELGERSNALDVLIEVALFKPDEVTFDAVPNSAGTKVIYAFRNGSFATHWAHEWTTEPLRSQALETLKATTASSVGMSEANAPNQPGETSRG